MTEEALSRELKTCGMAFFVTYFSELNSIDWYNNDQVEALKREILNDLQSKARPDGGDYTYNGLGIRFSSLFIIFSAGEQWNALVKISNATRVPASKKPEEPFNAENGGSGQIDIASALVCCLQKRGSRMSAL